MIKLLKINLLILGWLSFNLSMVNASIQNNVDSIIFSLEIGKYSIKYNQDGWHGSSIEKPKQTLLVPYIKSKQSVVIAEDEYGELTVKKIKCFDKFEYHLEFNQAEELQNFLDLKLNSIKIRFDSIYQNITSISISQYSNLKYLHQESSADFNQTDFKDIKIGSFFNRKKMKNGGYLKLYINYEYQGKGRSLALGVLYTGGNQEKINKKYKKYLKKGKILLDKNNSECVCYCSN